MSSRIHVHSEPRNASLVGNKVFVGVFHHNEVILAKSNMTSILIRRSETDTRWRKLCEGGGRYWRDTCTHQGMLRITDNQEKLEEAKKAPPPTDFRESNGLDFRPLAFRTVWCALL